MHPRPQMKSLELAKMLRNPGGAPRPGAQTRGRIWAGARCRAVETHTTNLAEEGLGARGLLCQAVTQVWALCTWHGTQAWRRGAASAPSAPQPRTGHQEAECPAWHLALPSLCPCSLAPGPAPPSRPTSGWEERAPPRGASGYLRLCAQAAARGLSLHRSRLHFGGQCPCCADVLVVEHPEVRWGEGGVHTWPSVCSHMCVSVQLLSWVALRCFL